MSNPSPSRIVQLSTRIASNTAKIDAYLTSHSLPTPSFAENATSHSPIPSTDPEIASARMSIIRDSEELRQLMLGPREHIMSYRPAELQSLHAITHLNLAQAVPLNGQAAFADIARTSGIAERPLRKILRHAIARRIFMEPSPGIITHSAASRLLAEDDDFAGMVQWHAQDVWPAHCRALEAITTWPGSEEPFQTGFALAHYPAGSVANPGMSLFEYLGAHPGPHGRFAATMRAFLRRQGVEMKYTVEGWRDGWRGLLPAGEAGVVVDVGGSHGQLAIQLARSFSENEIREVVVQDVDAPVVLAAEGNKPEDVKGRVRYMVHDCLTEQPVRGADIYVFRAVLHNWSDKYCVEMLRALVPALKLGAHVVVNDAAYPEAPEVGGKGEENAGVGVWRDPVVSTSMDLTLWTLSNGGHRDLDEWERLFAKAGPGFRYKGAERGRASDLWNMVLEWVGEEVN